MEASTSIRKALRLLEQVGLSGECTFAQISAQAGLPKSTLHRLLNVLIEEGFIIRSSFGTYHGSLKLWRIAAAVTQYDTVRQNVVPLLRELVETTSETALYAVYESGRCVYVAKQDGTNPIRAATSIGDFAPAHASATGKAILSWQTPEEIVRVVQEAAQFTPHTCTDPDRFLQMAEQVRRNGYSVSRSEWHQGLWGIAAPIMQPAGEVGSAIGITGPEATFTEHFDRYVASVLRAGHRLSRRAEAERATDGA